MADDQIKAGGQPLRVETRSSLHGGIGELRELTFIWRTRPDYFNVTFEYYEPEKGDVSHAWFAENGCLRPLWMRGIDGGTGEARLAAPEALARN